MSGFDWASRPGAQGSSADSGVAGNDPTADLRMRALQHRRLIQRKAAPEAAPADSLDGGVAGGVEGAPDPSAATAASPSTALVPLAAPVAVGTVDYYFNRNQDFVRRHPSPPPSPPDYYLNYGNKYAHRFTEVLKPKLSDAGKKWVDRTFLLLQNAIEDRRIDLGPKFDAFEQQNDAFRGFAYGTHPDSYLRGGLHELPPSDLFKIATTPDAGDILNYDGIKQIIIVGLGIVPEWGHDMGTWAEFKLRHAGKWAADKAGEAEEWGSEKAHEAGSLAKRAWHGLTD